MESQAGTLIQQMGSEVQGLPDQMLREVLDFIGTLKQQKEPMYKGSPKAILRHTGAWVFEPGEVDGLLSEIAIERESEA